MESLREIFFQTDRSILSSDPDPLKGRLTTGSMNLFDIQCLQSAKFLLLTAIFPVNQVKRLKHIFRKGDE
jgi:hypothetical protein